MIFFFLFSCATTKNRSINKAYHSLVSSYNVLFNGNSSLKEGLIKEEEAFEENFWEILPVEKITLSQDIITVDGIENANFLKGELKAAKTVQKHSMNINGVQRNPKIASAYMLLGKARYLDQRFVQALDAFNQVTKQKSSSSEINESKIWIAKCNIRLEQEALAINGLKKLIKNDNLSASNQAHANAVLSLAFLETGDKLSAMKPLKIAANLDSGNKTKSRYLYILGQLYEDKNQIDSAQIYFKQVSNFKRRIPRDLYINAKLKDILYNKIIFKEKEKEIFKMIENYENEQFLDKIYYTYSLLLYENDLIEKGVENLNKSIRLSNDPNLLYRSYKKLADFYFQKPDYVLTESYLDSTLTNLSPKSKMYWQVESEQKGLKQVVEIEQKIKLLDSLVRISNYSKEKLNSILISIEKTQKNVRNNNLADKPKFKKKVNNSSFYFYNESLVELGKKSFNSTWGNRVRGTYWRSNNSGPIVVENLDQNNFDKKQNSKMGSEAPVLSDLSSQIPNTKAQKDSILSLKNRLTLRLSEIYLTKYKDYISARKKIQKIIELNVEGLMPESLYLLYKIYKAQNDNKQNDVKNQILSNYNKTRFAKILENPGNLISEKNNLYSQLDSLQKLFYEQRFEDVIKGIDQSLVLTDDSDVLFDYDLLKAKSIGRMEGVNSYEIELQKIINKYPSKEQTKELKTIANQIKNKWTSDDPKDSGGTYLIIIVSDFQDIEKLKNQLSLNKLVEEKNIYVERYNYETSLIVLTDFNTKEDASNLMVKLDSDELKNNFVVLSSQYKNMLIYKTLDKYLD